MAPTIKLSDLFDTKKKNEYNAFTPNGNFSNINTNNNSNNTTNNNSNNTTNNNSNNNSISNSRNSSFYIQHDNGENNATNISEQISPSYVFRGFVCYYGLHYISIFQVSF